LTAEQLQAARAAHWRQNQSPILTLDDAQSWLRQHPLCLYLPRRAQLPVPAPSFVEACMGNADASPGTAALEQAHGLVTRLIASGTVVALNLLGTVTEQPDFLAHSEALPFILALRADADWKHAPQKSSGHKVSPLVLELWKVLDKEGAITAATARETLGRELTEAAVLRALCELWQALRVSPGFEPEGQATRWELLRVRHREALAAGSATSQVTALSLLVSMYLQSVYAATSEEIEVFLSPLASRSRVREAVRGLSATRQIHSLSMDAQTYHFIEDGLPEFAETAVVAPASPAATTEKELRTAPGDRATRLPVQRRDRRPPPPSVLRPASGPRSTSVPRPASSTPRSFSAPRPAPFAGRPAPKSESRPEPGAYSRPATQPSRPAAKAGWKSPGRTGQPARPPIQKTWQKTTKPHVSGPPPRRQGKDGDAQDTRGPRPPMGSRPSRPSATRPDARTRTGARPPQTGRLDRPGRDRSPGDRAPGDFAPRPRPGQSAGFGQRPPRSSSGRPGETTFRGTRPAARVGTSRGAEPFGPRAPRGEQGPGGRTSSYRPQGPPPAADNRRAGPTTGRPAASFRQRAPQDGPRPGGGKPPYRPQGRPPATSTNRPAGPATGRPAPSFRPRGEQRGGRPPGERPSRSSSERPAARYSRDRAQKFPKNSRRPGEKTGDKPRSQPGGHSGGPPFVPKPWSRPGDSPAKPANARAGKRPGAFKGGFKGRKPDRKKTGA
jgi:23S rRNA pseudouridine2605 synthase